MNLTPENPDAPFVIEHEDSLIDEIRRELAKTDVPTDDDGSPQASVPPKEIRRVYGMEFELDNRAGETQPNQTVRDLLD